MFVLLDEPTAALDPLSEYEIYTNFDKIVVFHEGRLVQTRSHEELVKDKNGKYYEMWNAQAQYYRENGISIA